MVMKKRPHSPEYPPVSTGFKNLTVCDSLRPFLLWAYLGPVPSIYLEAPYQPLATTAWLVQRGAVRIRRHMTDTIAKAGQWLFPGDGVGWQSFTADTRLLSVHFEVAWPDGSRLFTHDQPLVFDSTDFPSLARRSMALVAAARGIADTTRQDRSHEPSTPAKHFHLQQHFSGWLSVYSDVMEHQGLAPRLRSDAETTIADAIKWVDSHPMHKPLREPATAAQFGMTVARLNRLFVQAVGATPSKYFDARRREYAIAAVEYGQEQMKTIARNLGFSSAPHFTRWFRKQTGKSPSEYRVDRAAVV